LATYHAIAAIGQAFLGLLEQARPASEFDSSQFALYQATNFHSPMDDGVSLFLYNVAISTARRNLPPKVLPDGRHVRDPISLDLFYLLTPWARSAARQHSLLAWAMRVIDDTPTLPAPFLNHYAPTADTFRDDETVTLVNEPISLQDIYNIWEIHKQNMQVSVAYLARVVAIDSTTTVTKGPPVQTREFDMARMPRR
jgi:hypothetical protein